MPFARITIKAQPGARRNEVAGYRGEALLVRVTAPPEGGKANEAIIETLAEALGIAKSSVTLVRGAASRQKVVQIEGIAEATARRLLDAGSHDVLQDDKNDDRHRGRQV
ncbi:MAG: DUF167 domain-containing protein [Chloroflexi bacterium]|nr:DUF167 domain-containing protein [Chloroflexota bacterium]